MEAESNIAELNPRRLPDFIRSFEQYASVYNSTPRYIKAAAIWMLATAVGRAVAMRARGNQLCPNLFLAMVGGPGTGKSQAVTAVRSIFVKATNYSIIPASITRAGLEDYMQENMKQRRDSDGTAIFSHECIGLSEEMQGILPDQDLGHLTLYNILYDLPRKHKARTRTHGEVELEMPYCSIFTGAQPAFLGTTLPEQAWGMGFMSRLIMVFDTPPKRRSAFELQDVDFKLQADLIHDLRLVNRLCGWMAWDPGAVDLYNEWWVKDGGQPVPGAKRLRMGYNSRRELHFLKLAMVMSLSRGNDLRVTVADVARAIEWLLSNEATMTNIFAEMTSSGSMVMVEDMLDMVRLNAAKGELTHEADVINMLMQRFPSTQVHSTVENLIASKALVVKGGVDARGFRKFGLGGGVGVI